MLRLLLLDLFTVGGSLTTMLIWFNNRKKKVEERVIATFVGGPLDGRQKKISRFNSLYVHKDLNQIGDAVYKHRGNGIYEFDEFLEG